MSDNQTSTDSKISGNELDRSKEFDRRVAALNGLHTDLKVAARHHETISMAIIAAQFALMTSVGVATGSGKHDRILSILLVCNLFGQYLACAMLLTHKRGVDRHRMLAGFLRGKLSRLIDDETDAFYRTVFKLNENNEPMDSDIWDRLYGALPIILSGCLLLIATIMGTWFHLRP